VGDLLKKEIAVYGAFIGKNSFETTARIMESGHLPLDTIVSHRLPLGKVHEGIELLRAGKALKVVIEPENE
jgi:threonine dehydrogenase-like Zn-dependent dehydrogenase